MLIVSVLYANYKLIVSILYANYMLIVSILYAYCIHIICLLYPICLQAIGIEVADGIDAAPALACPPLARGGRVQPSTSGRDTGAAPPLVLQPEREPKTRRYYNTHWLSAMLKEDTTSGRCIFGTGVRDMIIIVLLYQSPW
jgi:hypothetical protein